MHRRTFAAGPAAPRPAPPTRAGEAELEADAYAARVDEVIVAAHGQRLPAAAAAAAADSEPAPRRPLGPRGAAAAPAALASAQTRAAGLPAAGCAPSPPQPWQAPAAPTPEASRNVSSGAAEAAAASRDGRTVRVFVRLLYITTRPPAGVASADDARRPAPAPQLSSTFRDMSAERAAIFRSAVPRLQRALAPRGLFLVAVDLRWGITPEQAQGGEVVRLCLLEVLRSTHFVAFLKRRYGWHQDPSAPEDSLLARSLRRAEADFPFVARCRGQSVTELEIRLGALLQPEARRTPRLPRRTAAGPHAVQRLEALKEEVRRAGLAAPRPGYASPDELAAFLHDDLLAMIDRDFPPAARRSWLEEERAAHAAFAAARRRLYLPSPGAFADLDEYANGSGPELLLLSGPSGSGKSALLANWAAGWRARRPGDLLVEHFVGGTPASARVASLAQRLVEEGELVPRVSAWLAAAAAALPRGARLVLIVDAADQLVALRRPHALCRAPALDAAARAELIRSDLAAAGAPRLALARLQARGCSSPLFLTVLLEELKAGAVHETLEGRLAAGLACPDAPALCAAVYGRWEGLYGRETVRGALCAAACVRDGIAESELRAFLAADVRPRFGFHAGVGPQLTRGMLGQDEGGQHGAPAKWLPDVDFEGGGTGGTCASGSKPPRRATPLLWAEFFAAACASALVSRDGLLAFHHRAAREAAEAAYGLTAGGPARPRWHAALGAFFAAAGPSNRRAREAPWQLAIARAGDSDRLVEVLGEADVLRRLMADRRSWNDLVQLWGASCVDALAAGTLLRLAGRLKDAEPFLRRALDAAREAEAAAEAAGGLANLLADRGDFAAAEPLFQAPF
eukprot:tig00000145_g8859.t1